ncbi:hypothetical protein CsSME_00015129 [Camellia sinensis var. sinensis]
MSSASNRSLQSVLSSLPEASILMAKSPKLGLGTLLAKNGQTLEESTEFLLRLEIRSVQGFRTGAKGRLSGGALTPSTSFVDGDHLGRK